MLSHPRRRAGAALNPRFDFSLNIESREGPALVLGRFLEGRISGSVLDVGCGRGAWIRAALEAGCTDVLGVDVEDLGSGELLFPKERFRRVDLAERVDLGSRFDVALCLEVAEHLPLEKANTLVDTVVRHANTVLFSAASPAQQGQAHVNCQWPGWWQHLFNERGFVCNDEIRWSIWGDERIEPWYRQNLFVAESDPGRAGREKRIAAVYHPHMKEFLDQVAGRGEVVRAIENGSMPVRWYLWSVPKALWRKVFRRAGISK